MGVYKLIGPVRTLAFVSLFALTAGGCAITGTSKDLVTPPATLVPATKTGLVLDSLPPPRQKLDVAVYNFPDLTGQNKSNDNFAEFSRAVTQGGSSILTDVLVKAGGGAWFDVAERADLQSLLQERQIIQNTRTALMGKNAQSLPPLRFAGVLLDGGVIGSTRLRAVSAPTISASAATSPIARISSAWRCGPSACRPGACWRPSPPPRSSIP